MKIWHYYIPSDKLGGWGKFIIDSTGYFSCVSDFGNYAFQWSAHGDETDFREFLLDLNDDYLMSKLSWMRRDEFDDDRTRERLKESIIETRRASRDYPHHEEYALSADEAREVWDELESINDEHEFIRLIEDHYRAFPEPSGLLSYNYSRELQGFCKHLWPRFVAALKEDLAKSERVLKKASV